MKTHELVKRKKELERKIKAHTDWLNSNKPQEVRDTWHQVWADRKRLLEELAEVNRRLQLGNNSSFVH